MFNVTRDHNVFGLQRLLTTELVLLFDPACSLRPSKGNIDADTKDARAREPIGQHLIPNIRTNIRQKNIPNLTRFSSYFFLRNSVPQSPNFPVANASAHETVLQRVTEMFKLNFPYTTVYPALGNLDVLHPRILEREASAASGSSRDASDHYRSGASRGHKKRRKWSQQDHHFTARCESPMTSDAASVSDKFS